MNPDGQPLYPQQVVLLSEFLVAECRNLPSSTSVGASVSCTLFAIDNVENNQYCGFFILRFATLRFNLKHHNIITSTSIIFMATIRVFANVHKQKLPCHQVHHIKRMHYVILRQLFVA